MDTPFDEIAADAMKLPLRDRVRLAQRLVSSLDDRVETDVEKLWGAEAERRLEELRNGRAKGIDAPTCEGRGCVNLMWRHREGSRGYPHSRRGWVTLGSDGGQPPAIQTPQEAGACYRERPPRR